MLRVLLTPPPGSGIGVPGYLAARNTPTPNELFSGIPHCELSEIGYLSDAKIPQMPDVPAGFSCYPISAANLIKI
jgi:hypothetical protein